MNSSKVYIEEVLRAGVPVLAYNGAWDGVVGAAVSEPLYSLLDWPGAARFRDTPRRPWKVAVSDQQVAGFASEISVPLELSKSVKGCYSGSLNARFARVVVRRAGHILPADQPSVAFDMIDRFISGRGWGLG